MNGQVVLSVDRLGKAFATGGRKFSGISMDGPAAFGRFLKHLARPAGTSPEDSGPLLWALRDLSLNVREGEVLGVIGRNGAGKSTLLKILARVLYPTEGRATIRGRVVSLLHLGTGYAPDLTVRENIQVLGRLAGVPSAQIRQTEERILAFARLSEYRDVPLQACPGGSFVNLAFATLMNMDASVVLADEVLAVGDSDFRRSCEEKVNEIRDAGGTVLFVSHDMGAIRRLCTRVVWLDRGRLRMDGKPEEVVAAYTAELLAGNLAVQQHTVGVPCRLLDLRLVDGSGSQVGAAQICEPFRAECLLRLEAPNVAALVQFDLFHEKSHVFSVTAPRWLAARGPTVYRVGIRIPPDYLNEHTYRLRCRISVAQRGAADAEPVMAAEETLEFSVMNPHPERSVWRDWQWGRGGVISPRLEWKVAS